MNCVDTHCNWIMVWIMMINVIKQQPFSVAYLAVVWCMFLYVERENCTSFSHVIAACSKLCIMSYCVCFMRMFGNCLINIPLSWTHFSLLWYFVSCFLNNESYKQFALHIHVNVIFSTSIFLSHMWWSQPPYNMSMCGDVNMQMAVWMCQYLVFKKKRFGKVIIIINDHNRIDVRANTHNHSLVLLLTLSQVSYRSVLKTTRKGTCASSPTPSTPNQATWKTKIPQRTVSPRARCWSWATRSSLRCFWRTTTSAKTELDTAGKKTRSWGEDACSNTLMLS